MLAKYAVQVRLWPVPVPATGWFWVLMVLCAAQAYPAWKENRERTKAHFRSPYKGGFEEEMTRREAALILGVRYVQGLGWWPYARR